MNAAKHTPPRDPSFRRSLLRNVAGAAGLVVLVAAVFGVLGMIGRADPDRSLDIADGTEEPGGPPAVEDEEPPAEEAPVEEAPAEEAPVEEAPVEETPVEEAPAEEAPEEGEPALQEDEEEPAPQQPAIEPSTISVQVLDGYRDDGGAAATAVYEQLQAAGYRIIARNPALRYDVTTVLWTAGYEEEARQVAAEIDAPEVREQPGNLSTQVNVHVVVGADRG